MIRITIEQVKDLAFEFAQEHLKFDEPIPDFSTRFPNKLESCLIVPFQKFDGKYLYPNFISRAAILFYLMTKNHPFQNGNKRIAVTTLLLFLGKNKKWLNVNIEDFYHYTKWVTESPASAKNGTVKAIEDFIAKYITDLE